MVKLFGLGLVLVFMVSLKVSVMVRIRTPLFAIAPPPWSYVCPKSLLI